MAALEAAINGSLAAQDAPSLAFTIVFLTMMLVSVLLGHAMHRTRYGAGGRAGNRAQRRWACFAPSSAGLQLQTQHMCKTPRGDACLQVAPPGLCCTGTGMPQRAA